MVPLSFVSVTVPGIKEASNIYKKDDDGNKGEVHLKFGYMNLYEFSSLFSIPRCVLKEIH